jgi:hypothetical protein
VEAAGCFSALSIATSSARAIEIEHAADDDAEAPAECCSQRNVPEDDTQRRADTGTKGDSEGDACAAIHDTSCFLARTKRPRTIIG